MNENPPRKDVKAVEKEELVGPSGFEDAARQFQAQDSGVNEKKTSGQNQSEQASSTGVAEQGSSNKEGSTFDASEVAASLEQYKRDWIQTLESKGVTEGMFPEEAALIHAIDATSKAAKEYGAIAASGLPTDEAWDKYADRHQRVMAIAEKLDQAVQGFEHAREAESGRVKRMEEIRTRLGHLESVASRRDVEKEAVRLETELRGLEGKAPASEKQSLADSKPVKLKDESATPNSERKSESVPSKDTGSVIALPDLTEQSPSPIGESPKASSIEDEIRAVESEFTNKPKTTETRQELKERLKNILAKHEEQVKPAEGKYPVPALRSIGSEVTVQKAETAQKNASEGTVVNGGHLDYWLAPAASVPATPETEPAPAAPEVAAPAAAEQPKGKEVRRRSVSMGGRNATYVPKVFSEAESAMTPLQSVPIAVPIPIGEAKGKEPRKRGWFSRNKGKTAAAVGGVGVLGALLAFFTLGDKNEEARVTQGAKAKANGTVAARSASEVSIPQASASAPRSSADAPPPVFARPSTSATEKTPLVKTHAAIARAVSSGQIKPDDAGLIMRWQNEFKSGLPPKSDEHILEVVDLLHKDFSASSLDSASWVNGRDGIVQGSPVRIEIPKAIPIDNSNPGLSQTGEVTPTVPLDTVNSGVMSIEKWNALNPLPKIDGSNQ